MDVFLVRTAFPVSSPPLLMSNALSRQQNKGNERKEARVIVEMSKMQVIFQRGRRINLE